MTSTRKHFLTSMAIGAGAAIGLPLASRNRNQNAFSDLETGSIPVLNVKDFGAKGDGKANDTEAIQRALSQAKDERNEIVYVPEGIYSITEILIIYQNTTLHLDKNAVIIRKAEINAMLINGIEHVAGYDGQSNITVEGGTWDGNSREFPSNVTPLGFGHARNITVQNLTVLDVYNWHHLEINAIDGATIRDCLFDGMILTRAFTEMVQIDLMGAEGMFPWFGRIDNTTCRNVLINRCIFQNGNTAGIGTHSTRKDARHEYITITNCEFINLQREGIVAQNWQNVKISNNFFRNCNQGILMEAKAETDCTDITIVNNKMVEMNRAAESGGIQILSEECGSQLCHILIEGNYISETGSHGIEVDFCDHTLIKGNTVKDSGGNGIWSQYSNNVSILENSAFRNAAGIGESGLDIRINTTEARYTTAHHIISSNNAETCRVDAAEECLVSNNIFKQELETEQNSNGIRVLNNFVGGEFKDV